MNRVQLIQRVSCLLWTQELFMSFDAVARPVEAR